jgi:lincosamide nucleotidyltransferase A/C/D/E
VARPDDEAVVLRARALVHLDRDANALAAAAPLAAFAHEVDRAVRRSGLGSLAQLRDPLVHLAEERFVPRLPRVPFVQTHGARSITIAATVTAADVLEILDRLDAAGVHWWIDGGWGVDALLEEQTREHDDLDLVAHLADAQRIVRLLDDEGYEVVAGGAPKSFVAVTADGRQVDVHPVTFDHERGGGVYLMDDGQEWVYPAAGFDGRGKVAGRVVRCLTPEVQVLVHDGYELGEKDFRELRFLHERFGVELPAKYAARVRSSS